MADAFAKIHGKGIVEAYSAGSKPSGKVNQKAIEAMKEIGYDLTTHESKSLDDIPQIVYDYVVSMGCGEKCPLVSAKNRIDWDIPDPKNLDKDEFGKVRNLIKEKVKELMNKLDLLSLKLEIHDFTTNEFISMMEKTQNNLGHEIVKNNILFYGTENYYNLISKWMKKE